MSAETQPHSPASQELIYAKLMFLSSAVGFMDDHPEAFDDNAGFALSVMLSEIAKEVWPEWKQEPANP